MRHYKKIFGFGELLSTLSILAFFPFACAAQFQWAHQIGSSGNDMAEEHVVDPDGNIIVTGYYENSVAIGGVTITSMDESDVFLYKTRPDGTVLWVKSFEGPVYGGDVGVDTDENGNIYIAGGFISKLYFNGTLRLSSIDGNNYWNSFLAKLDPDGNLIWIKGILGTTTLSEVRVWGLISVNKNSIAIAGNFSTGLKIDSQVLSKPVGSPGGNLFIARFDLDGNIDWLRNIPSETNVECSKILADDAGDLYLTGLFTTTAHFDSFTISATNDTHSDIYLAKLNSGGVTQWVKTGLKMEDKNDNNIGRSLTLDPQGNVYLVGNLKGDVKFDDVILHGNAEADYTKSNGFVAKYDKNGQLLHAALFGEAYDAFLTDIEYSSAGMFLLGTSRSSSQFFYSLLDDVELTGQIKSLTGYGYPLNITISQLDAAIIISGQMSFLTLNQNQLVSKGNNDGFVARVGTCTSSMSHNKPNLSGPGKLCLNTEITYDFPPVENAKRYVWEIPAFMAPEGDLNSDDTHMNLKVKSGGTGMVSVYAVDECGQSGNKAIIQVTAFITPVKPELQAKECAPEIVVSNGENLEWYKDNMLIPGASGNSITVPGSGSYHVVSTNYCGSSVSDKIFMNPVLTDNLFFQNVITPNNDGKNDSFQINNSILNSELTIYDRWGLEVFKKQPYDNSWSANNVSEGIYFYSLHNGCFTNLFKGWIQVIKGKE